PSMEQPQYNLLDRDRFENEYGPLYEKYGLGTTIWSPLASGALTGKYLEGIPEGSRASLEGYEWLKKSMVESDRGQGRMKRVMSLVPIAEKLNVSMSNLAIAWCLLNKNVSTVILGASKLDQLEENLRSMEVLPLLDESIQEELKSV
ncbi:MAG: aldo/keto reductase, partial [SAR86 cluster bacterium]|nr:aldo/keto reductase [SAR86 cluster bacterium]